MKRLLLSLMLSVVGAVVLFVGAAMADGACHCMTSMFTLFPYGSFVMMHFSSDFFGLPLALLQFPIYAIILTVLKGLRLKVIVLLLLITLHIIAASFALRDYCQSRRTCSAGGIQRALAADRNQRVSHRQLACDALVARPLKRSVVSNVLGLE